MAPAASTGNQASTPAADEAAKRAAEEKEAADKAAAADAKENEDAPSGEGDRSTAARTDGLDPELVQNGLTQVRYDLDGGTPPGGKTKKEETSEFVAVSILLVGESDKGAAITIQPGEVVKGFPEQQMLRWWEQGAIRRRVKGSE